jgi:glycerol uptake facilitator-like aquaporin
VSAPRQPGAPANDASTPIGGDLARRTAAEFLGSLLLAAIVVGSGIAAMGLTDDVGVQLLINAVATAFGLFVLITVLSPISGAHFNPVVSLADIVLGRRRLGDVAVYIAAQVSGCIAGVMLANVMFDAPTVSISTTDRVGAGQLLAEVVATAGLILAIFALVRTRRSHLAAAVVACYITSSTSFANPAVTIGRVFSDSFAGIAPGSVPWFVAAQFAGALLGVALVLLLLPRSVPRSVPRAETVPADDGDRAVIRV